MDQDNESSSSVGTLINEEEVKHFQNILRAFASYDAYCSRWLTRMEKAFTELSKSHQNLIPNFHSKQEELQKRVQLNNIFLSLVCESTELFQNMDMVIIITILFLQPYVA